MSIVLKLDPFRKEWDIEEGIAMARFIEPIAVKFNAHVGLTGGTLYKDGTRKDLDIVFYPHGGSGGMDEPGLIGELSLAGFAMGNRYTRVQKASWQGKDIDFIFPHHEGEPGCDIGSSDE